MPSAASRGRAPARSRRIVRQLARQVVWLGVFLLAAAALLLAARRLAGALQRPLTGSTLAVTGLLLALIAWSLRTTWRWSAARGPLDRCLLITPSLSLLLIAAAISIPASPAWGLVACWLLIGGEEAWAWRRQLRAWRTRRPLDRADRAVVELSQEIPSRDVPTEMVGAVADETHEFDEHAAALDVRQQITRGVDAEGRDVLVGTLHAPLRAGQRDADLHIAFCPPFARTPTVEAYLTEGPACRVTVPQVFPHGARIDARLDRAAAAPETITIEVVARAATSDG